MGDLLEPQHLMRVGDRERPVRGNQPAQEPIRLGEADDERDLDQRIEAEEQAAGSTHGRHSTGSIRRYR